jgi:hypothetical protein
MNLKESEQKLLNQIKKSQEKLKKLRQKRKLEIGALAIKHNLDELDNALLEEAFINISQKHKK